MRVSTYAYFILKLNKTYGIKKPETSHIVTSPIIKVIVHEDSGEDVLIIAQEEEPLPPPATEMITSRGGSLAYFQYGLEFLTFGAPCMIDEMHEEEETNTSAGTLVEV